jgi:cytosine/adenosine deaminase-related metal-dependent hydrolase
MVKILIKDATILTLSPVHDIIIDEGYIFIKDGTVTAVGKGEPPDEFQYPELFIDGRGRIVTPGFSSGITAVTLYPFRYELRSMDWSKVSELLSTLTRTDVYYMAVLALAELVSRGVTTALVSDLFLENVARAVNDVGIHAVLAPPFNCGLKDYDPSNELKLLLNRWHGKVEGIKAGVMFCNNVDPEVLDVAKHNKLSIFTLGPKATNEVLQRKISITAIDGGKVEGIEKMIRSSAETQLWKPGEGLGIGVRPSYSMTGIMKDVIGLGHNPLDVLVATTSVTPKLIGFSRIGSIDVGNVANIVMFNTSEPPGWPIPQGIEPVVRAVIEGDLKVETVIVGDNIVVDAGETLTVGAELIKRAIRRLDPLIKKK